jgi:glycosyltransferase involved in cell wall biosynthesis
VTAVPARSWNGAERLLGVPYPLWSRAALKRLARGCRGADVVHLHDCLYAPTLAAFAAARRSRRPVLVTQHVGRVPYRNPALSLAHAGANRLLGARVLAGADRVVFESQSVLEYFGRFVRYRAAPLLVQNGVDTDVFNPVNEEERREARARLGLPLEKPLLLFVGRFVEKKGMPVLRELTGRLPNAHWVFAGWGPLDPGQWRRPNVTVVDRPTPEQLPPLYRAAELFVLPSVGEGFPLSVQEAMACGTPALIGAETAAGCPQSEDALLAEATGSADTLERWTRRLASLLASPAALLALRAKAASFAREHWSWQQCTARYADLLASCARQAPQR